MSKITGNTQVRIIEKCSAIKGLQATQLQKSQAVQKSAHSPSLCPLTTSTFNHDFSRLLLRLTLHIM